MSISRLVIVGASLAGLRAAQAARKAGFDGELVMVGEERHLPYTRPPLSKELLAGEHDDERVHFPCDTLEAEWRLGVPAASLDRGRRRVVLADGDEVSYDRLIVATGSRPRRWPGAGGELDGVHVLRNLEDALALRAAFAGRPRVAIVGAGFIGCEVAQTARKAGLEVTLIDVAATPMLPLGPELGEWCAELHREQRRGPASRHRCHGAGRRQRSRRGRRAGGRRARRRRCRCHRPRRGSEHGVAREQRTSGGPGLACDATLTAADDPDILGAGDIVSWPHPLADGDVVRIEHWTVAAEQGQLAGRNALAPADERKPYDTPPYFWSDQYDKKIQSIGFPGRADRLEQLESTPDRSRMVYAGERDGRVVGVIAINAARRLGAYRMALEDPPAFEELRAKIAADPAALGAPSAV